jgi:hypothetical protein
MWWNIGPPCVRTSFIGTMAHVSEALGDREVADKITVPLSGSEPLIHSIIDYPYEYINDRWRNPSLTLIPLLYASPSIT